MKLYVRKLDGKKGIYGLFVGGNFAALAAVIHKYDDILKREMRTVDKNSNEWHFNTRRKAHHAIDLLYSLEIAMKLSKE